MGVGESTALLCAAAARLEGDEADFPVDERFTSKCAVSFLTS